MRIYKESGDYIGGVGLEDAGKYVIIPWDHSWRLRVSGSLRIGYLS